MKYIPNIAIYLTGFFTTILFLLCGIFYSSNKTLFIWTLFGGLVFGLLSGFLIWQNEIWKNQSNTTLATQNAIEPNISCLMIYPIKVEKDNSYRNTRNPTIIIKNSGPVEVVSLSAKIDIYVYSIKDNNIDSLINTYFKNFDHAVSAIELKPFTDIEHSTMGINGNDIIAIYSVSVIYYRKSDMKSFTLNEYFFTHKEKIFNDLEFKNDERYQAIIEKVKSFAPSDIKGHQVKMTAAAEHTWFMEANQSIRRKINDDGSITFVGPPEGQSESLTKGLPHILATPSRFKSSGFFIEPEIAGEHIKMKVRFEVKNIGDVAAVITEDGFTPIAEIGPGERRYFTKQLRIDRGPNNNRPLQEFIDMLETDRDTPKITLNFLYWDKSDNRRLFQLVTAYELGLNSFKLAK